MPAGPADIMLVEDNRQDAELAIYALSKGRTAPRVDVLRDGVEALDYIYCSGAWTHRSFEDLPRLVLLDLKIPRVDGLEVLRRLRGDARVSATPIVMLTSSREERDVTESYRRGANSYVVKPVDFEQFAVALQAIGTYWLELNEPARPRRHPGGGRQ